MNACLNPRNGASLTNTIDVTAHSISLLQENGQPKNTTEIFIPRTSISIAEPIDVQIDELGYNTIHMYQFTIIINDEKVPGLESILNYMKESFFSKDDPAINEHRYHITKKTYNEETHNIYNTDKPKSYNIKNNRYTDGHHYNKTQNVNNNVTNSTSKTTLYRIMNMH